jgi:ribosome-binding factor A
MSGHYKQRLESHIFEILTDLLTRAVRDPRVEGVVVTGVELNDDYSVAKVYTMGGGDTAQRALRGAGSFLRGEVGRFLKMKNAPELRFYVDDSLDRYNRVEELLEDDPAAAGEQEAGGEADGPAERD